MRCSCQVGPTQRVLQQQIIDYVLKNTPGSIDYLVWLVQRLERNRRIAALVLGLPRNMDGSEGPRAQSTRAFARNLIRLQPLPILLWDERLSTVAAERALLEADTSRKRRAEVIDHVAAGFILQGALDRLAHIRREAARE